MTPNRQKHSMVLVAQKRTRRNHCRATSILSWFRILLMQRRLHHQALRNRSRSAVFRAITKETSRPRGQILLERNKSSTMPQRQRIPKPKCCRRTDLLQAQQPLGMTAQQYLLRMCSAHLPIRIFPSSVPQHRAPSGERAWCSGIPQGSANLSMDDQS